MLGLDAHTPEIVYYFHLFFIIENNLKFVLIIFVDIVEPNNFAQFPVYHCSSPVMLAFIFPVKHSCETLFHIIDFCYFPPGHICLNGCQMSDMRLALLR